MAGPLPVFAGPGSQRGYGLGGMLSGLFRTAVPFLKRSAASLAKEVGKEALTTGAGILEDVMAGQNIKRAATRRGKAAGRRLTQKALTGVKKRLTKQVGGARRRNTRRPKERTSAHLNQTELNRFLRQTPTVYGQPMD